MKKKIVKTEKDLAMSKDKMAPIKQLASKSSIAGKLRDRDKTISDLTDDKEKQGKYKMFGGD